MSTELRPKRRQIFLELAIIVGVWPFLLAGAVFTESFTDPTWYLRARLSSWPALVLLTWIAYRLMRLVVSDWAVRVNDDDLACRASYIRDFTVLLDQVDSVREMHLGPFSYTIIREIHGKEHWVFDRLIESSPATPISSVLAAEIGVGDAQ